jgi:hypothetical protein
MELAVKGTRKLGNILQYPEETQYCEAVNRAFNAGGPV